MKINGLALNLGCMTETTVRIFDIFDSAITRGLRLCARAPDRADGCFRAAAPATPLGREMSSGEPPESWHPPSADPGIGGTKVQARPSAT